MMLSKAKLLRPTWPAPCHVQAGTTLCALGDISLAKNNPLKLPHQLNLPSEPCWLNQVHEATVVEAGKTVAHPLADASFTRKANTICAVLTADCLPILITNKKGSEVAAIHGGWRGLAAGIIAKTVQNLAAEKDDLYVWLGPAIGPDAFEVGDDVYQIFQSIDPGFTKAFLPYQKKWLANLFTIATLQLQALGIHQIFSSNLCTHSNPELFFSYRRNPHCGRMATLIWFQNRPL